MKTFIATSFAGLLFASTAFATDVNTTLQFNHENQSAEVQFQNDQFVSLSASVGVLPNLSVSATYNDVAGDYSIGAEYGLAYDLNEVLAVYGSAGVEYTLGTEVLAVTPVVGTSLLVTDRFSVYAEAENSWAANDDWSDLGGSVEVGAKYALNDTFYVQPSASKAFGSEDVAAGITVGLNF